MRIDNRKSDQMRALQIIPGINPYAAGSVEVTLGNTKVHITAHLDKSCPPWMKDSNKGWITAEYGMLPGATHSRNRREASAGKQTGRTVEIQRLIGRSLRAACDLTSIPGITIQIDCDVLVADGGTRCASITGAWVALAIALDTHLKESSPNSIIEIDQLAALSGGMLDDKILIDLCFEEDSNAEFDCNLVVNSKNEIVEVQGTAEGKAIPFHALEKLYSHSLVPFKEIFNIQKNCISDCTCIRIKESKE